MKSGKLSSYKSPPKLSSVTFIPKLQCNELTDAALNFLSQVGYDPEFGARPVKRAIQRYLLNDLSKKLLAQEVDRSKAIIVDAGGDGLVFRN